MKQVSLAVLGVIVVVIGIVLFGTLFTVDQREQVLVLRVGEPRRVIKEPGLNAKFPFFEDVVRFDRRILDYDARAAEVPTQDQKQLVVDSFARYRITNPLLFFQKVTNETGMELRLDRLISSNLRAVFGNATLATLLTLERARLMRTIADRVKEQGREFGIDVIDVRIKHVDLPPENSQAIFRRMQTQREQEARKIRAEGEKESRTIRATADKEATIIRAEAQKTSEILRGEGEAGAQRLYNDAYGRDREFFDFLVSMNALREGLGGESTKFIGSPTGGDFFRFFGDQDGKPGSGSVTAQPGR
ncbi:MAG: protease modulator HflC [Rhodospirillales bacterium]|jgi:membrane protease subunit HflC|nr:protease modulator HflC [Rhodospirillales bacterium]MDP6643845.1 protease modulator HflC [Rhodospirillales bacterium]MDP6843602.1 protease modulator HflC [Rhodospirillales bacterium]|tara:strand:+ start:2362 stop:3270 length:909 start_codon:yes stop_codon:yes gene_type:complete